MHQSQANSCLPFLDFPVLPSPQVLQANDNAIESLDGVTSLPRLQELSLCNNRILLSECLSGSRWGEVPQWGGTHSKRGEWQRGMWNSLGEGIAWDRMGPR